MRILELTLAALLVSHSAIAQQQASAYLEGVVVQATNGLSLAGASVELRDASDAVVVEKTHSDAAGRFFLPAVRPGSYRLYTMHSGYIRAEHGQRSPSNPGVPLTVAAGQRLDTLRLSMTQGGVISGRVTDKGQPVGIADVVAMKTTYVNGNLVFQEILSAKTNDLGEYSIFWLPPGRYYLLAMLWDTASNLGSNPLFPVYINPEGTPVPNEFGRRQLRPVFFRATGNGATETEAHVPVYFPGTTNPEAAAPIEIRPGAAVRNIDIDASPVKISRVRGTVTGIPLNPTTREPERVRVAVVPRFARLASISRSLQQNGTVDRNGRFEISKVPAGSYLLVAGSERETLLGRVSIEVAGGDLDTVVALEPTFDLSGRVTVESSPDAPTPVPMSQLGITLAAPINRTRSVRIEANGTFQMQGDPPWDYNVFVTPVLMPPGSPVRELPAALRNAYVKAIRLGDMDVLNRGYMTLVESPRDPLEIVIGTNGAVLEGRVVNSRQEPLSIAWVALLPRSGLRFRAEHKFASTDADGRFRIQGVAPGEYDVFAWEDAEKGAWQDPGFLRDYEGRGTTIQVEEGRTRQLELTAIPPRN